MMNDDKGLFYVEKDSFNSEHFGIKMGNVLTRMSFIDGSDEKNVEDFKHVISKAKENGYKHLTFKVPTNEKKIIMCATSQGMEIADTLVRYVFDFTKSHLLDIQHKCSLDDCRNEELQFIKAIAKKSFKIDRFHSDNNLPDELCDLYYDKWIENSFNGYADKVIVAHYNNDVVGFTTGNLREGDTFSQLVLSAVSDKYRGIGVYTSMIHEGTKWLHQNRFAGTKGVIVGTQIDNIAVQRAWIKLGYSIFDSQYVFQKFFY